MVRLLNLAGSGELAAQVNDLIGEAIDHAASQHVSDSVETIFGAEGLEALPDFGGVLIRVIIIDGLEGATFSAIHTVDQVGMLDDRVIAIGDGLNGPVIMAVTDPEPVYHEPRVKRTLETNAAKLINELNVGLWVFAQEVPRGALMLVNPPHRDDDEAPFAFSNVNPYELGVIGSERWAPISEFEYYTGPFFVRTPEDTSFILLEVATDD